jgi:hypothetical protein
MGAQEHWRPAEAAVFEGETDACVQLLRLFSNEQMKSVVAECLRLGQMDSTALVRLQASDPAAFNREFGVADDLLDWARRVKDLTDQIFIRVASAKADWD